MGVKPSQINKTPNEMTTPEFHEGQPILEAGKKILTAHISTN